MFKLLLYIILFLGIVPALLALINKLRLGPIAPFIYLTAIAAVYEGVFSLFLEKDSAIWFATYDIMAFLTILYYFYRLNFPKKQLLSLIFLVSFLVTAGSIYILNYNNIFFKQQGILFLLNILVFIFTILWFWNTFLKMEVRSLWKEPDFYYISGLFIYHATTFMLFLLSDIIIKFDADKFIDYWILNIVANFLLKSFLIVGVWRISHK